MFVSQPGKSIEGERDLHLGIKDTSIWFDDHDSLIEGLYCDRCSLIRGQHDGQVQLQFLRLQFRRKFVLDALALTSRDLNAVAGSCQVANDSGALWRGRREVGGPEGAADEDNGNRFGFFIGDRKNSLSCLAIDKLDAEDLG